MATTVIGCDWTVLPSHLLGLISERLSVVECIRFGAVCTCWNSAVGWGRCLSRQYPWLIAPGDDGEFSDTFNFFSLSDNKSFRVTSLPELRGKWWVGSADGWIVTLDEQSELRLFNPLTRAQFQLPSITTFPDVEAVRNFEGDATIIEYNIKRKRHPNQPPFAWSLDEFRRYYIYKVILCTATGIITMHGGGYIAMAIFDVGQNLAFAKAPYDKWMVLDTGYELIEDVVPFEGKFYSISSFSEVRAWDLSGPSPNMTIISERVNDDRNSMSKKYLVESNGDLLQVRRSHKWYHVQSSDGGVTDAYTTNEVIVLKFDSKGPNWIPVNSLDNRCLFLGLSRSMSLSPKDIPGLIGNCIYFTDDDWVMFCGDDGHELSRDLGVFNLEDGSFKPHYPCNSQKNWPAPIWLMPNPFKWTVEVDE